MIYSYIVAAFFICSLTFSFANTDAAPIYWVVMKSHKSKGLDLTKEAKKLGKIVRAGYNHYLIEGPHDSKSKASPGILVEELKVYRVSVMASGSGCGSKTPPPTPPPPDTNQVVDWGVKRVDALRAQAINAAKNIKVCVLDTGISKSHTDLKYVSGRNFTTSNSSDFEDRQGHGTHTAGLVAATNNLIGVVGASQAQLFIGKVLDDQGSGYNSWIADGIHYCVDMGVNIISMSLGGPYSSVIEDAVERAVNSKIDVVAAAGNESSNEVGYPAAYTMQGVYSISATGPRDELAWFSNYGKIEYAAPGLDILSTVPGGYDTYSGTSMATPIAAGIMALYKARGIPYQAENIGSSLYFGRGLLTAKGLK